MSAEPMPIPDGERDRIELTMMRERMMVGDWKPDLLDELAQFFAPEVLARMTHPDTSRCPQKFYNKQKNVLYSEPPKVEATGKPDLRAILPTELWPLRQRGHLMTLGLRECLMRLDWHPGATGVSYRVVTPSTILAYADPKRPNVPVVVIEFVERVAKSGAQKDRVVWTRETWDIRDPKAPIRRVEVVDKSTGAAEWRDVTADYPVDEANPAAYPYLRKDGTGIFPWVLYHAEVTDRLWSWEEQRELVDGTLKVGALWTLWFHGCRDCSHPQRASIDLETPSAARSTDGARPVDWIPMDQSSILMLYSKKDRSGRLETMAPAMDPKAFAEAVTAYSAGLAEEAGLSAADVQIGGTTGQSGYAIVVSRDGLRRAWKAQVPSATMGDQLLLATAAQLANAYGSGPTLPESSEAYTITYAEIGKAPEEVKADLAEMRELESQGVAGPLDTLMKVYPTLTRDGAIEKAVDIARQKGDIEAAMQAAGLSKPKPPAPPRDTSAEPPVPES